MKINPVNLAWFGALVAVIALSLSKALLSITTGIFAFSALWYIFQNKDFSNLKAKPWIAGMAALFLLSVIAGIYTDNPEAWIRDVRQKIPLVVIPVSLAILPRFSEKQYNILFASFVLAQTFVALVSLGYYFADYEFINEAIKKNANIDIIGSINHIYFGLLLAFSIFLAFFLYYRNKYIFSPKEKWIYLTLMGINFICLHILTSRTGLVAFYMGTICMGAIFLIREKAFVKGIILLGLIILTPWVSYQLFPSFKYRVDVTVWDVKQYLEKDQDLTEKSASLRLLAWENALKIFLKNPVFGVGIADLESEMAIQYKIDQVRAKEFSRPTNPHNQYLEYLSGLGLIGLMTLIFAIFYPFWHFLPKNSMLFLSFLILFMSGMLFESLLERQIGMSFFVIFMMLLTGYQSIGSDLEEEIN